MNESRALALRINGLKVNHDFEELDEGEDRILTLKDSRILDNEGALHTCNAPSSSDLLRHRG